jgi:hypothetical protein
MSDETPEDLPEPYRHAESTDSDSKGSKSTYIYNKIDQELADQYGWTPQQARESQLYL